MIRIMEPRYVSREVRARMRAHRTRLEQVALHRAAREALARAVRNAQALRGLTKER